MYLLVYVNDLTLTGNQDEVVQTLSIRHQSFGKGLLIYTNL